MDFSIGLGSLFEWRTTSAGYGRSGLPRHFLWRYFIVQNSGHPSDFHWNGSWCGGSHWPPHALKTPSRCLAVDWFFSSDSIARNFIAIFLVYGSHIIIMLHYLRQIQISSIRQSQHCINSMKIYIYSWQKIGSSYTLAPWRKWNTYKMESDGIWIL